MNPKIRMTACALAACALVSELHAQETVMEPVVVKAKRENRVSKGATGLPMEIKETPQTISTIEKQQIKDFGATSSNDVSALPKKASRSVRREKSQGPLAANTRALIPRSGWPRAPRSPP